MSARRWVPAALVALACGGVGPATAHSAPGDIGIADEGNWFGSSGRVLRLPSGGSPLLLAGGAPLVDRVGQAERLGHRARARDHVGRGVGSEDGERLQVLDHVAAVQVDEGVRGGDAGGEEEVG